MKSIASLAVVLALAVATNVHQANAAFFSDFELDDGGFVGTGDWERGIPVGADGTALGGVGGPEPVGGFSGDFVWGTVIGGLHSPSTVSQLTQTFDLSAYTNTKLSFQEWIDSGGSQFDMAQVFANGTQVYLSNGLSNQAFIPIEIDLSAFDGLSSVEINFQFSATAVVERVGWYIDDVSLSSSTANGVVPEPSAFAIWGLLGLTVAGYARLRRRK